MKINRVIIITFFGNLEIESESRSMSKSILQQPQRSINYQEVTVSLKSIEQVLKITKIFRPPASTLPGTFLLPTEKYNLIKDLCKKYNQFNNLSVIAWFTIFLGENNNGIRDARFELNKILKERRIIEQYKKNKSSVELIISDNYNNKITIDRTGHELISKIMALLDNWIPPLEPEDEFILNAKRGRTAINNNRDKMAYGLNLYLRAINKTFKSSDLNIFIFNLFKIAGHPFTNKRDPSDASKNDVVRIAIRRFKEKL